MRLQRETIRTPRAGSRLNRVVFVVAVLWLAASLLLLLGSASAVQPRKATHQQLALLVPQAAARASFIY